MLFMSKNLRKYINKNIITICKNFSRNFFFQKYQRDKKTKISTPKHFEKKFEHFLTKTQLLITFNFNNNF